MYPPTFEVQVKPENLEIKDKCPSYHCDLCDRETSHKIARSFLPGLASACVDNTTGGLFNTPGSVALDIRKEMVEYLTQRSETFVAESAVLEDGSDFEVPEHPYDIISDFVDDFASSKRNFFSGVSVWLLSERREERIDDFVQELETNQFWLIERRETIAKALIKNVDFKNMFHCNMKFNTIEELSQHLPVCSFRTINCTNEGCNARFTAARADNHDSVCPFKILLCEQKCSGGVMRREMDRHCVTVCPMKLVSCPFYQLNCQSTIPRCEVEQHNFENLHSHMLNVLRVIHKEASIQDLKERVEQLEKSSAPVQLAKARDVRSLTLLIKGLEAKLGPLETSKKSKLIECAELPTRKEECTDSNKKQEESRESPRKEEEGI
ncbi:hypothetical protein LguiB_000355 [Lonicera macranthoides]